MVRRLNLDLSDSISQMRYLLRGLEVRTKRYKVFFRGKSFEFDGYRPFTWDDDMNDVDWKASAKGNQLLIKQFKEEEDKKIFILVDIGETMVAGSTDKLKCEYAAEIILSLVDTIVNRNDRVGLIMYNDKIKSYYPAKRGRKVFEIYFDELSNSENYGGKSNIIPAIDFLESTSDTSVSSIIIVSDFLNFNDKMKHHLEVIGNKFETMALIVKDPTDLRMPDIKGEFVVEDPKTGQQMLIDPKLADNMYKKYAKQQENYIIESLKDCNVDYITLVTDKPFVFELVNFLVERLKWR